MAQAAKQTSGCDCCGLADQRPVDAGRFLWSIDFNKDDKRRVLEIAERSSAAR
jgi:hypothetical protein